MDSENQNNKRKKPKYLSLKYFSLIIISFSFLLTAYNNVSTLNDTKPVISSKEKNTNNIVKKDIVKNVNSRKLKPKEYLDLAESYSEKVLETI